MMYRDRRAAGRILAESISQSTRQAIGAQPDPVPVLVLGLPRGGVPVAFEVAKSCNFPLDVLVVRKLGVPGQRELAMGATTGDGTVVLNNDIIRELHIREETIQMAMSQEQAQAQQQEHLYRQGLPPLAMEGRTVILVDDGLATGATMRAAVRAVRSRANRVIVAVPVGAIDACTGLAQEADLVICPHTPVLFGAVGQFYRNFDPTSDEEVSALLLGARSSVSAGTPSS